MGQADRPDRPDRPAPPRRPSAGRPKRADDQPADALVLVEEVVEAEVVEAEPAVADPDDEAVTEDAAPAGPGAALAPSPGPAWPAVGHPVEDLMAVTLPLGAVPESLADQRAWAELRRLQIDTEKAAVELRMLRRREHEAAVDAGHSHVYTFYSGVDSESVQQCMSELGLWSRRDPGAPITIIFNSPGGGVHDGLALFDFIRQLQVMGHHVTTIALGRAASMGAVLLQAGDRRVVGQNAFVLIHEVSHLSAGKVSEMADSVEFTRRLQGRLLDILSSRSTLTAREIQRRWTRKEWWMAADEAVGLGFADEIL